MAEIIKGGNLPLSGEPVRVAVVRRSEGPGAAGVRFPGARTCW